MWSTIIIPRARHGSRAGSHMCVCVSYFLFQAGLDIKKKKPYVKFANDIYSRGNIKRPLHFFFKSAFLDVLIVPISV